MSLSRKEIEIILLVAAYKLNKYGELLQDKESREKAVTYFENNASNQHSATVLADIALLGVMSVYIPGEERPVVRYNWGNETSVPDFSPFTGGAGGGSTLDEEKKLDNFYREQLSVQAKTVVSYLKAVEFDQDFLKILQENNVNLPPTAKPG